MPMADRVYTRTTRNGVANPAILHGVTREWNLVEGAGQICCDDMLPLGDMA